MDTAWMERTALMIGQNGIDKLLRAHVLVMGLGGVGSYAAEALARAGVGKLTIVDGDVVDPSNRNRQLQALSSTHGMSKALLMEERLKLINPEIIIEVVADFQGPTEVQTLVSQPYDYVIDAIDSLSPKIFALKAAFEAGNKIVSSMGAGGKMDPTLVRVIDISKTSTCPLAYQIRRRLKEFKINKGIQAVYSTELPMRDSIMHTDGSKFKKSAYGTISYLPAVFGLTCASVVIRYLVDWQPITAQDNMRNKAEKID
jgi:tRNA threonylcarbamoyladenosine dehydratase